jgi:hypothetical protein
VEHGEFLHGAQQWFQSTRRNDIVGWNSFPCVDVMMGCTHFIESFVARHGWDGFQILPEDYAYYTLMGKVGTAPGDLRANVPLIVSLPNWKYGDIRPDWDDVLKECERKNIDVHIDFAWLTVARNIKIDLSHPSIRSFGMSMSKYNLQWNRIGLRWSRQRTMDSITLFNHYTVDANSTLSSVGVYMIDHIPRDYGWDTYQQRHHDCCDSLGLLPTNLIHVAHSVSRDQVLGIGRMLEKSTPHSI